MIFHDTLFILLFLPLTVLGYYVVYRIWRQKGVYPFLLLVSLVFYSFWGVSLLLILLISLSVNFFIFRGINHFSLSGNAKLRSLSLLLGIVFNIGYLGWFKYSGFLSEIANFVSGVATPYSDILPVGISFYTFIQIGFLLSVYSSSTSSPLSITNYFLFGSFFPYVTAGPLVNLSEMEKPGKSPNLAPSNDRTLIGLVLFVFGLSKKILVADSLAPHVNEVFLAVHFQEQIGTLLAILGSVGYMLQLYFDFSGYSDMALGLALIFGIYLPLNFFSPFKSTNIIDFWRRWHMTMTRFFTNYIYTPLAFKATRKAMQRKSEKGMRFVNVVMIPTVLTFLFAGIWHGAGWNFAIFGLIHGVAITVCHFWRAYGFPKIGAFAGQILTTSVFCFSLIFFRTGNPADAIFFLSQFFDLPTDFVVWDLIRIFALVAALIVLNFLPNTREILGEHQVSSDEAPQEFRSNFIFTWKPTVFWVFAIVSLASMSILFGANGSPFIYYKF